MFTRKSYPVSISRVFLELGEFSVKVYIIESADVLYYMTTTNYRENSVIATLEIIALPNHRFAV